MDKNGISKIAHRVFLAMARTAKFTLDYDSATLDEQGVFVELDGNLDYNAIDESFASAKDNVKALAEEFSKALLNSKDTDSHLKDIDVESVDVKNYRIVHDENNNKLYLFLPLKAIKKKKTEEMEKAVEEEGGTRSKETVDKILQKFHEFITEKNMLEYSIRPDALKIDVTNSKTISLYTSNNYHGGMTFGDGNGYSTKYWVSNIVERKARYIISSVHLSIKYKGDTVYNKVVERKFNCRDYGIDKMKYVGETIMQRSFDMKSDNGECDKFLKKVERLVEDVRKSYMPAFKAFAEDLARSIKNIEKKREGK